MKWLMLLTLTGCQSSYGVLIPTVAPRGANCLVQRADLTFELTICNPKPVKDIRA
jgi:hypothetical protein